MLTLTGASKQRFDIGLADELEHNPWLMEREREFASLFTRGWGGREIAADYLRGMLRFAHEQLIDKNILLFIRREAVKRPKIRGVYYSQWHERDGVNDPYLHVKLLKFLEEELIPVRDSLMTFCRGEQNAVTLALYTAVIQHIMVLCDG